MFLPKTFWVGLLKTNQLIFILFQCCESGKFNPDPNLSIPDPDLGPKKILDPGSASASKNKVFLT
jgi:hypothetical protein